MIDIEKELEEYKLEQDVDFDAKIEEIIGKRMRRIALRTCIAVVLVLALIFAALNPMLTMTNPNPDKLYDEDENGGIICDIYTAYVEATMPYVDVANVEVKKKGFGCYDIDLGLMDRRASGTWTSAKLEMIRGKLEIEENEDYALTHVLGKFQSEIEDDKELHYYNAKEDMEYIDKLPDSAYIYMSVTDSKVQDITDLLKMNNDDLEIVWAQVYQPDVNKKEDYQMQAGISLSKQAARDDDDNRVILTSKELRDVYIKNLKLLKKYPEMWSDLHFASGDSIMLEDQGYITEFIEACIKDASEAEELKTCKYCVYGSKEMIKKFLQEQKVACVRFDKINATLYD